MYVTMSLSLYNVYNSNVYNSLLYFILHSPFSIVICSSKNGSQNFPFKNSQNGFIRRQGGMHHENVPGYNLLKHKTNL